MRARWLHLLLAIWAGSMCTIMAVVAPLLFVLLPDRHLAGTVAGFFFNVETAISLVLGSIVLSLLLRAQSGDKQSRNKADLMLVMTAMLAPVVSEFILGPFMQSARDTGNMTRFGLLHGGSALLFVIACVSLLIVVWRSVSAQSGQ